MARHREMEADGVVGRELRTFPRDDDEFRSAVEDVLGVLPSSPDLVFRLEAYLHLRYPAAVVHEGSELAELLDRPLYAYRYGTPTARG